MAFGFPQDRFPSVTAEAASQSAADESSDPGDPPTLGRSVARYLWAVLLARIYEVFPLTCPRCGAEMRIIAFITEAVDVRAILEHIGEPAIPPRIAPARDPPEWDQETTPVREDKGQGDPLAQPEPVYEFDQRLSW